MKKIIFTLFMFFLVGCSQTGNRTVLICGDHICINKSEAENYFKENLSIEVQVLNKTNDDKIDLVELNLKNTQDKSKKITLIRKENTNKEIKSLSKKEIKTIKEKLKKNKKLNNNKILKEEKEFTQKIKKGSKINKLDNKAEIYDVCKILEQCNIDEISKYLIKQSKNKDYPDITVRE